MARKKKETATIEGETEVTVVVNDGKDEEALVAPKVEALEGILTPETMTIFVQIPVKKLVPTARLPEFGTPGAAGADVFSNDPDVVLRPGDRRAIGTGLAFEIPQGFEVQLRAKSGLALNKGLGLVNGLGTIDSDYRGEVKAILINLSDQPVAVKKGDKIAQVVVAPVLKALFFKADEIGETARGEGGFGSTGDR